MSKINKIKAMLQNVLSQFAKISTDKGLLSYDGDKIEVGLSVMVVDENGNEVKAENGDYKADDGTVYVIADGKISEIKDAEVELPQEEPKSAEENQQFSIMHRMAMKFESYFEKEQKIIDAIRGMGIEAFLMEAGDDYAVVEVWANDDWKLFKYSITWSEDSPVVGAGVEVKPAYVPVEQEFEAEAPVEAPAEPVEAPVEQPAEEPVEAPTEPVEEQPVEAPAEPVEAPAEEQPAEPEDKDARIAGLEQERNDLLSRIADLEKKLNEPAAEPASTQFENAVYGTKTDDDKLNNLRRFLKK